MISLNVPVPGRVGRLAADLAPLLAGFDRRPRPLTLVIKRLGSVDDLDRTTAVVRRALAGTTPFDARVVGIDRFESPATGGGPVVFLAIDSEVIEGLHRRLCEAFEPVEGIEGADYVPHVTLAQGGEPAAAERLMDRPIDDVQWTVTGLVLWDSASQRPRGRLRLPVR